MLVKLHQKLALFCLVTVVPPGLISTVAAVDRQTAFTYGQDSHIHVTNGTVLPFNKVITSVGQGATFQTPGIFICPEDGVYKFQMYCLTQGNTTIWLELYRNQELVTSAWGHTNNDYADAGNAAILQLSIGDRVYVKTRDNYKVDLYGTADQIYTTFTGTRVGTGIMELTNGKTPGFSVGVSAPRIVPGGSTVLFDKVILNDEQAYDTTTGVYTAKTDSIFVFHFFALAKQSQAVWLELFHNSDYVCAIYGRALADYSDAGNTVILHLKVGDTVQLKARSGRDNEIFATSTQVYTTFSGAPISVLLEGGQQDGFVAFSAGLTSNVLVTGDSKVKFDQIFIDLGQGYNHLTGEFTAPVAGLYEFNFHALGQKDKAIWLELYHNYKYVDSLYSKTPGQWATGSNAAVLQLDGGDVIYVKARHGRDNLLFGARDQIYTTFSGYIIEKATPSSPVIG